MSAAAAASITTPPSTSSSSSSAAAATQQHPSTPPSNDGTDDDLALDLDLDHPEPDVDADDVEWGGEASAPGQRSIRLKPLSGARRNTDGYGDGDDEDEDEDEEEKRQFLPGGGGEAAVRAAHEDYELYTPDEERAVLRRLDRRLVLFMGLLYMLSFLDRSSMCGLSLSFTDGGGGGGGGGGARVGLEEAWERKSVGLGRNLGWLMRFYCRYRQCEDCGFVEGLESQLESVRVVAHGLLRDLYCV